MVEITPELIQARIAEGAKHCLVHLKRGPKRDQSEADADAIQAAHLRYLFGLMLEKKLVINGPVFDHPELVGVSIYRSADRDEVKRLVEADPGVQSGRLTYEVFDWFSIDGLGFPAP